MNDELINVTDRQEKKIPDISKTLRSEFHFLRFPFFDLSPRSSKKDRIEIKEIKETEEGNINIWWKVIRGLDNNLPSSFARKIHKEVVEKAINDLKRPISRLIKLGSLWQICKKANITPAGRNYKEIRRVLKDIKTATIDVKGTFRQKEKSGTKKFFEGTFNLYDMVFFTGETLPDGTEADVVYVLLSDMYVQNFNNNFVVPLDYQYLQSLEGDIASRMYEVLSVWFYPALENRKKYIQKQYSEICNYFPLTRQDAKWKARGQLKSAHQQHVSNGFLASEPEWIDTYEKSDWLLRYYIGPRAKDWYQQNKKLSTMDEGIKQINVVPIEEERRTSENPGKKVEDIKVIKMEQLPLQFEENPLINKLVSLDVARKVAENLVNRIDAEIIEDQTGSLPYRKNIEDKPAFLIKAIQENYPLPEEFKKKKAKEEWEREEKLKTEYHQFLIVQAEEYLKTMDPGQIEKEIEDYKEIFFSKRPPYFREDFWESEAIKPQISYEYKIDKAKSIGLPSLEDWKSNIKKTGN